MDLFQFIANIFSKTDNIAIIVLGVACGVSMYLHVVWRREEREDRKQLYDLVQMNTKALNDLRVVLAGLGIKQV